MLLALAWMLSVVVPTGPTPWQGSARALRPGPEPGWVVFADRAGPSVPAVLHRAPVDGRRPTIVLARHDAGDGVGGGFLISEDRRWLLYLGDEDQPNVSNPRLFSVPLDGSRDPVRLSLPGEFLAGYAISPDSRWVVYKPVGPAIFVVPIEGGVAPVRLNDPPPRPSPAAFHQRISSDSRRVVYLSDISANNAYEVLSVPIDRSAPPVQLTPGFSEGRAAISFTITPDGQRVVYLADLVDDVFELFVAPIDGGSGDSVSPALRLNGPLVAGGDVDDPTAESALELAYQISPDGERVVYLADQDADEVFELYSVSLLARQPVRKLNAPLPAGGDVVRGFCISPDGSTVVYRADQEANDRFELYSVPIDGQAPPLRLNSALPDGGDVGGNVTSWFTTVFAISPEGSRVVYIGDQEQNDVFGLFSVPIDGGEPPVSLTVTLAPNGDLGPRVAYLPDFVISPDGGLVSYWADPEVNDRWELYCAPIKGNEPARKLNGALVAGGDVGAQFIGHVSPYYGHPLFQFAQSAQRVVYMADQDADEVYEIFSAPSDGSAAPVRLHDSLAPLGGAFQFLVVPDP